MTASDRAQFRRYLSRHRAVKPASVNRKLEILRRLCQWAHSSGKLRTNVAAELKLTRAPRGTRPKGLLPAEVQALLRAVGQSRRVLARRNYAVVQLLLQAGLRVSEAALSGSRQPLADGYGTDPGCDPNRVLLASLDPFLNCYDEIRGREFYRSLVGRVAALPGIESATLARRLPLTLSGIAFTSVTIDGYAPGRDEDMRFNYETVGPKYFSDATHSAPARPGLRRAR